MTSSVNPPRISLGHLPTPFHLLKRVSADLGGPRIWIKRDDLSGLLLTGNKVRKLEFLAAQAVEEGCDTLITCGGIQSNHCRATASVAVRLGLEVCLILREDGEPTKEGNLFLDQLLGARIVSVDKRHFLTHLPELIDEACDYYLERGRRPFVIPLGGSDEIGLWGYYTACEELKDDFQRHSIAPSHIVVATGSGGTQAGLTAGAALHGLPSTVLGMAVCDSAAYFQRKVRSDLEAWIKRYQVALDVDSLWIETNDNYKGPAYGVADREVYETIRYVARREGILLDPVYTGKAFHGLMEEIRASRFRDSEDIVFVHTGGLFGLFPHAEQFDSLSEDEGSSDQF